MSYADGFEREVLRAFGQPPHRVLPIEQPLLVSPVHVLQLEPGAECGLHAYVTVGAASHEPRFEFLCYALKPSARYVELLAMITNFHVAEELGLGDTFPLGEPWSEGSTLDCGIICSPSEMGIELDSAHVGGRHVEIGWVLPITQAERAFKVREGLGALQERFAEARLDFSDDRRASIV